MLEPENHPKTLKHSLARGLAESWLLRRGKESWARNQKDFNLNLSRADKLLTGMYVILKDYSEGRFPPTFPDQQKAYDAEIEYVNALPGMTAEEVKDFHRRKPFWYGKPVRQYLRHFLLIAKSLERLGIAPPAKILELGCGGGWTADFLAQMKYQVIGTTISPHDTEEARKRVEAFRIRGIEANLDFITTPMETVDKSAAHLGPFDAVIVFEALHHAYDWRKSCQAAYRSLKPGGWFLLCNEPNLLHTFIAYRISRLANSHEIGFRKREVFRFLEECGFRNRVTLAKGLGFYARAFWIAVRRPPA